MCKYNHPQATPIVNIIVQWYRVCFNEGLKMNKNGSELIFISQNVSSEAKYP